LKPQPQCCET